MTKDQIIKTFTAPDAADNCTMAQAIAMGNYLAAIGMPYTKIKAVSGSTLSPADEISLATLQAMKFDANTPLYFAGEAGTDDSKAYTIGLDLSLIAGKDGTTSFLELYADRNPGGTAMAAEAAVENLPVVQAATSAALDSIRAQVK